MKLVSEVNWSKSSNICLICSRSSLKRLKHINKNAISTLWIIAKVSQKLYYIWFHCTSFPKQVAPVCLILSAVGSKSLLKRRCKKFCFTKLTSTRSPQSHQCLNGFFLTVFIVAVSFLRVPFTIICACIEAGGRNKSSIGIKALHILGSSSMAIKVTPCCM